MNNILNVFFGALTVIGFWIYESLIFGVLLWGIWNFLVLKYINLYLNNASLVTIPDMHYLIAVGILLLLKLLKFDSGKISRTENNE